MSTMSLLTGKCNDDSLPTWEDYSDPLDGESKSKKKKQNGAY